MNKGELNNLMLEVQNGNEFAFEILYKETHKGVFSFIYSYVQDFHTTEDLLQETFIKVKTKAQSYIKNTNVLAWILQIAKNTSLDYLRKEKNNKSTELKEDIIEQENDFQEKLPLHDLINRTLGETDKQIVILHLEFGYKTREIAKILDLPLGTVLWKYNQSMKTLKEKLKED